MTHCRPNAESGLNSAPGAVGSKSLRVILICLGIGLVALGVLGIFLPVMPTTIFLLLAAACFVRSSDRLHNWLYSHRILGSYLRAVEGRSGLPRRAKITTLAVLWISILCSAFVFVDSLWLRILLLAIACGVSVFILTRETMESADRSDADAAGVSREACRQDVAACREAECSLNGRRENECHYL